MRTFESERDNEAANGNCALSVDGVRDRGSTSDNRNTLAKACL